MSFLRPDRVASLFVAKPLLAAGVVTTGPGIPILMYHSVSGDPEPGVAPYYQLATTPARFREQIGCLRANGYRSLSLQDALASLADGQAVCERLVVLTFDDGFRDFLTCAWPVLHEAGYTATMFLPTGYIGDLRRSFKGRDCLTWGEVRELHDEGVTFGSHTVTHPRLHGLAWTAIHAELRHSKAQIEDELQVAVDTFAYPYAFPQEDRRFAERFRTALGGCGYRIAVTTVIGRVHGSSQPLSLQRLPVNEHDERTLFAAKLAGAYDWVGSVQANVRRMKRMVLPAVQS